jgi:hypothetical protein
MHKHNDPNSLNYFLLYLLHFFIQLSDYSHIYILLNLLLILILLKLSPHIIIFSLLNYLPIPPKNNIQRGYRLVKYIALLIFI